MIVIPTLSYVVLQKQGIADTAAKAGKTGPGDMNRKGPLVVYTSRTHGQLQQVLRELRKTSYKYVHVCMWRFMQLPSSGAVRRGGFVCYEMFRLRCGGKSRSLKLLYYHIPSKDSETEAQKETGHVLRFWIQVVGL